MALRWRCFVRAFLLAGGRGERLRPLTHSIPKCLVPIQGTPLLAIWLDLLQRAGVEEVLVNVSHHADQVRAFLAQRKDNSRPRVVLSVERAPLGSAGTVRAQRWFVADEESFWVLYSDNLTNVSLTSVLEAHQRHGFVLTMALFRSQNPSASGIATLGADGRIVEFAEKPACPSSNLANAGIYLARQALFDEIPASDHVVDFGHDVLPRLVGRMQGHVIDGFLMDIGTPEALDRAATEWRRLRCQGGGV